MPVLGRSPASAGCPRRRKPVARRLVLGVALALVSGCGSGEGEPVVESTPAPPNILLYIADTLRADALATYGHPITETPVLDHMASEGALFENAFSQSSWTRASMASILTGNYPPTHGAEERHAMLSDRATLMSERLRGLGYRTAFITTNPNAGSFFGFDQGFDDFVELYERSEVGRVSPAELVTPADEVLPRAVEWLESGDEPFLLVILTIDPHGPYVPPQEFDRYGGDYAGPADGTRSWYTRDDLTDADKDRIRSLYYGEVAFTDYILGQLVEHLRRTGLYDRTITVFSSDHGEEFWEHGGRAHGDTLFDESIHVPLVIRYPPGIPQPIRVRRIVQSVDIVPTVFALARLPAPEGVEGRSLFDPPGAEEPEVFTSLRLDRKRKLFALRSERWKLVWDRVARRRALYDLEASPDEQIDVAHEHPEVVARLRRRLDDHVRRSNARFEADHGDQAPPQASPEDVPEAQRELLRELGYLEDDEE